MTAMSPRRSNSSRPLCCFIAGLLMSGQSLNAQTDVERLKQFLAHPPPIKEMALAREYVGVTNIHYHRYFFLRWQEGDYVAMASDENESVLQGRTDHTDGGPTVFGRFGDDCWTVIGGTKLLSVIEWKGEMNPPGKFFQPGFAREWIVRPLLTLGCAHLPVGGFDWVGNKCKFSGTNAELNIELNVDGQGRASGMCCRGDVFAWTGQARKAVKIAWFYQYEYGDPALPAGIPNRITRSDERDGTWKQREIFLIKQLRFADQPMTRQDFLPRQFFTPGATLNSTRLENGEVARFVGDRWQVGTLPPRAHAVSPVSRWGGLLFFTLSSLGAMVVLFASRMRSQVRQKIKDNTTKQ